MAAATDRRGRRVTSRDGLWLPERGWNPRAATRRLARTNREWHALLESCSIVGVLLIDAEAVYDPRLTNDRLLLGMKGTISEMEVASFRERAQAAILQKAQRGALVRRVPIGYIKGTEDRIENDPDARSLILVRNGSTPFAYCACSRLAATVGLCGTSVSWYRLRWRSGDKL
jgi:DNA invertase Pin-like site-specific DNA recombinase